MLRSPERYVHQPEEGRLPRGENINQSLQRYWEAVVGLWAAFVHMWATEEAAWIERRSWRSLERIHRANQVEKRVSNPPLLTVTFSSSSYFLSSILSLPQWENCLKDMSVVEEFCSLQNKRELIKVNETNNYLNNSAQSVTELRLLLWWGRQQMHLLSVKERK